MTYIVLLTLSYIAKRSQNKVLWDIFRKVGFTRHIVRVFM
jgi:hypothetical protein